MMAKVLTVVLLLIPGLVSGQQADVPVLVEPVALAPVADELLLTGTANARRTSAISPFSEGLVTEMRVDVGDVVAAGQVLARLDGVIAGHELATARASLDEARAQLGDAIRRRDEAARVHADNLIASSTYESTVAEADIRKAAVARLEAEYARQQEIVRRYDVRAPFAGVIAQKFVEVGQWVQRSQALFELVDAEVLRIDVPIPQSYFSSINTGTPATVRFDALSEKPIDAIVSTRVPFSDNTARTFLVRVELDNSRGLFAPGMSVRVTLRPGAGQQSEALHVPRDALIRMADGSYRLWLAEGEGDRLEARQATVLVNRFSGRFAVISVGEAEDPIKPGDQVIVRGNESLRPGQLIRIAAPGP
ncbi:MAG: efflux RND transporter periplasmic adaptor subunit [Gammaproteobacteria bacterium]